jgi:hypothetical protein
MGYATCCGFIDGLDPGDPEIVLVKILMRDEK